MANMGDYFKKLELVPTFGDFTINYIVHLKKNLRFLITSLFSLVTHFATLVLSLYLAHGSKELTTTCLL